MPEKLNHIRNDNLKKFNKSVSFLTQAIEKDSNNPNLFISLGNEYLILKKYELAFQSYLSAYKLNPKNSEISVQIGVVHKKIGNFDDAASAFLNAIKVNKNHFKAYDEVSNIYFLLGRHKEALEYSYKVNGVIQFRVGFGYSIDTGGI
jgi:tetratricopeptide (TPR) repeat protein